MSNLVSIILVASLGVIGNIIYFEYQTRKKSSKELLKQKLTNLLLPLYCAVHLDQIAEDAWLRTDDGDWADSLSNLPHKLVVPINKIIKENIYLADDELHKASLDFLTWAYGSNTNDRFQEIMKGDFDDAIKDKDFKKFYDIVVKEYNEARREYLLK